MILGLIFEGLPYCFPQRLQHFTFPPAMHKMSNFSTSSLTLVIFCLFFLNLVIAILLSVKWYYIVDLICIPLMVSDVEHVFVCLLAIYVSSLENVTWLFTWIKRRIKKLKSVCRKKKKWDIPNPPPYELQRLWKNYFTGCVQPHLLHILGANGCRMGLFYLVKKQTKNLIRKQIPI